MADLRQNQFACVGNETLHTIRVFALDEFVAVAVHDPRWRGNQGSYATDA